MIQGRVENQSKVLTTGQVARICNVAPRTVSKWFDLGQLRGYRIPGSRDRRIPVDQLVRFMKAHNMPLNGLDAGPRRVLLVLPDLDFGLTVRQQLELGGFQVQTACGCFEAGLLAERFRPHIVVLDTSAEADHCQSVAAALRREPMLHDVKLLAIDEDDGPSQPGEPPRRPFDARLTKPFSITQLIESLNRLGQ